MLKIPLKREYLRYYEDSRETHSDKVDQHNEGYLNLLLYPWYHVVQVFHVILIGAKHKVFIVNIFLGKSQFVFGSCMLRPYCCSSWLISKNNSLWNLNKKVVGVLLCKKWYLIGCFNQCQYCNQCFTFRLKSQWGLRFY